MSKSKEGWAVHWLGKKLHYFKRVEDRMAPKNFVYRPLCGFSDVFGIRVIQKPKLEECCSQCRHKLGAR